MSPAFAVRNTSSKRSQNIAAIVGVVIVLLFATVLVVTGRGGARLINVLDNDMTPTLHQHERIQAAPRSKSHTVVRGSVWVMVKSDSVRPHGVQRVVGLPGETIEAKDGKVWINQIPLDEPYLAGATVTPDFAPVVPTKDRYFLLGDNRSGATDSRTFGPVDRGRLSFEQIPWQP